MSGRPHPPSQMRAILQAWKAGRPVAALADEARGIGDPSFAAEALFALATDARLPDADAKRLAMDALRLADRTERDWRRAEALGTMAGWLPELRRRHAAVGAEAEAAFLDRLRSLGGKARGDAVRSMASHMGPGSFARLAEIALMGDDAVEAGKAVVKAAAAAGAADAVLPVLRKADSEVRARLLGAWGTRMAATQPAEAAKVLEEALDAVATVDEAAARLDIVRAIAAASETPAALGVLHAWAVAQDDEGAARVLAALGARADKLGAKGQAEMWLKEAGARAARIGDAKARASVAKNVEEGLRRLRGLPVGAQAESAGVAPAVARAAADSTDSGRRAAGGTRHVLALYDSYEGGLGEVHLRAVARAAPLCDAFDLDLALVGFPAKDLEAFVKRAGRETNIGEGRGSLERLHRAGRLHLIACEKGSMPDVSALGVPVATTPSPDTAKATAEFPRDAGRLVVLVGLGPKGLPEAVLRECTVHVEVTGKRVSLETATAMGVIAERMRPV